MNWPRRSLPATLASAALSCVFAFACTGDDGGAGDELGESEGSGGSESAGESGESSTETGAGETATETGANETITVSGDAFAFTLPGQPYGLIDGATISVLEQPEFSTVSDADGHFEIAGLAPGGEATFRLEAEGFPLTHTKTFTLPESGELGLVTFQTPDDELFDTLAALLSLDPDPATCQIVSTVTRVGKSIYDEGAHGEEGATVSLDPPLPAEHGPVYFNDAVIPDPDLVETSTDGGVLYTNVPPGTYVLSAQKDGVDFESVTLRCEGDVLVNASPPYGVQALE